MGDEGNEINETVAEVSNYVKGRIDQYTRFTLIVIVVNFVCRLEYDFSSSTKFYFSHFAFLENPFNLTEAPCNEREEMCHNRLCIPPHYLCDGIAHCADGSDEDYATARCPGDVLKRLKAHSHLRFSRRELFNNGFLCLLF